MPEKEHLNLVIIGHVDHGKSTTTGHLLYKTGHIDDRTMKQYEEESAKLGRPELKFSWILDTLAHERERGKTIELSFVRFETKTKYFTIIDAPGHRDFIKNMITGASQADAALLVISAKKGDADIALGEGGQAREHTYIVRTMGVTQLVVAINKMDDPTANWSQQVYEEIKKKASDLLTVLGFKPANIDFVPVSGLLGINLVEVDKERTPWYKGPSLLEALDKLQAPPKPIDKPLRIPIQDVYNIQGVGTVPVGKIATGRLKPGDKVIFEPAHKSGEVKSIEMHHQPLTEAVAGDNIGFNVKGISRQEIDRGNVCGHTTNPPTVATAFKARIAVLKHPGAITVGYTPVVHVHTAHVSSRFEEIEAKLNPKTGEVLEKNPQSLKTGDAAIVKLRPRTPVALELVSEFPLLGRFAIRDSGATVAVGQVLEIEKPQG
ncbi:MAG: translation elongation factor EF-1 subunit alpha [Candidatus Korarchaeota archaeon]